MNLHCNIDLYWDGLDEATENTGYGKFIMVNNDSKSMREVVLTNPTPLVDIFLIISAFKYFM